MTQRHIVCGMLFGMAVLAGSARTVAAQAQTQRPQGQTFTQAAPRVILGGGFVGMASGDGGAESGWGGVTGDIELPISRYFSVVGQIDHTRDESSEVFGQSTWQYSWRDTAAFAGVRVSGHRRLSPFAEILAGVYQLEGTERSYRVGVGGHEDTWTSRDPVLQAGGGVTFRVSPRFGVRTGLGFMFLPDTIPVARATVGAVVGLGTR